MMDGSQRGRTAREGGNLFGRDAVDERPEGCRLWRELAVLSNHLLDFLFRKGGLHPGNRRFRAQFQNAADGIVAVLLGIKAVRIDLPEKWT